MYVVPILLLCAALAFVGVGGRKLVEWLPVVGRVAVALDRRPTPVPPPHRQAAPSRNARRFPGDAARLRQWFDPETGAVMVHDPHAATLTAIVGVTHPAFILLDPVEQQRRVTSWGRVLATACRSGRIASLQVMERTLPDSGKGLAEWWSQHGQPGRLVDLDDVRRTDRPRRASRRTARQHGLDLTRHEGRGSRDPRRGRRQPWCRRGAAPGDVHDDRGAPGRPTSRRRAGWSPATSP
ncbi:MAG: SCO6880 family protein [Nocardioides sp.]